MRNSRRGYDTDALKQGIDKARENIKVFESAIEKEKATIVEYRRLIEAMENKDGRDTGISQAQSSVGSCKVSIS